MVRELITEVQKGVIGENLISNWLMVGSNGRLCPFRPIADDVGIDIIVYDRITRNTIALQVKTRILSDKPKRNTKQFNLGTSTFESHPNFYLLSLVLNIDMVSPRCMWLIPSEVVKNIARGITVKGKDKYVIRSSFNEKSNDKWSSFKVDGLQGLVENIYKITEC